MQMGILATALGLVIRGRLRLNWSFAAYVLTALTTNLLMAWAPERFYESAFYLLSQTLLHVLKFGVALEIAWRVINGTLWLMVTILVLARWYRVPVHPFHVAVLTGFCLYLPAFSILLTLIQWYGFGIRSYVNGVDACCYLALTGWWTYNVWRPETAAVAAHVAVARRLEMSGTAPA